MELTLYLFQIFAFVGVTERVFGTHCPLGHCGWIALVWQRCITKLQNTLLEKVLNPRRWHKIGWITHLRKLLPIYLSHKGRCIDACSFLTNLTPVQAAIQQAGCLSWSMRRFTTLEMSRHWYQNTKSHRQQVQMRQRVFGQKRLKKCAKLQIEPLGGL